MLCWRFVLGYVTMVVDLRSDKLIIPFMAILRFSASY